MRNKPKLLEMLNDVVGTPVSEDYPIQVAVYSVDSEGDVHFVPPMLGEHERYLTAYRQILGAIALMGLIDPDLLLGIGAIAGYVSESGGEPTYFEIAMKSEPIASAYRVFIPHLFQLVAGTHSDAVFITADEGEIQQGLGTGLSDIVRTMRQLGCFGDS